MHIRELVDIYATHLGQPRVPPFVTRYLWAEDRKVDRWFIAENPRSQSISKTTRRLNLDQSYPQRCWQLYSIALPFQCLISNRSRSLVPPWLCWFQDINSGSLMGFHVSIGPPTTRDILQCFRWSVWHYGASWWPARGVPEELIIPRHIALTDDGARALAYTRTKVRHGEELFVSNLTDREAKAVQPKILPWIEATVQHVSYHSNGLLTLDKAREILLDLAPKVVYEDAITRLPPSVLVEADCSLPWHFGIASALLLPTAGHLAVIDRQVLPWGVPFDLALSNVPERTQVDVRYDPYDARYVYVIHDGTHVKRAPAVAFEHRMPWYELAAVHDTTTV